jgi:hypothetical protein
LHERSAAAGTRLFGALAPLSIDALNKEPSQELMVLDADFLVDVTRVEEFDAAVERLAQERPELQFRYLGPMPAYSFADLELQEA